MRHGRGKISRRKVEALQNGSLHLRPGPLEAESKAAFDIDYLWRGKGEKVHGIPVKRRRTVTGKYRHKEGLIFIVSPLNYAMLIVPIVVYFGGKYQLAFLWTAADMLREDLALKEEMDFLQ